MRQNKDKRIIPLIKRDQRYSPFFFVPEQRRGEKPLLVKMCARIFTATESRGEAPCQVEDEIPPRPMSFRHMVLGIFCRPNLTDVRQGTVPTSPAKKSKQKGTNTMTRVSRHNGRSGSHGTYNSKHNDREFDLQNAEDIKAELTENNLYWNCVDQQLIRHGELTEQLHSFTEVEKGFYELCYQDYVNGQNARNIKAGHSERCRSIDDLRCNPKTCPEESIYQIGTMDNHVDYEALVMVAVEFLQEIQSRYGSHIHTLNWALHLDEGTPHIHERHVFDVINQYGERQPKQEQALKKLGFNLPDSSKKPGRYNNRKMSYDAECRKLLIDICKKHGIEIDEEPIYGGRSYMEKQEYIIDKLNADIKELLTQNDQLLSENTMLAIGTAECRAVNEKLTSEKESLIKDNEVLLSRHDELMNKISDAEGLLKEVSEVAYDKARNCLINSLADSIKKEEAKEIIKLKNEVQSSEGFLSSITRKYALEQLNKLLHGLDTIKDRVVKAVRKTFESSTVKEKHTKQIAEAVRPSIMAQLQDAKKESNDKRTISEPSHQKAHETSL